MALACGLLGLVLLVAVEALIDDRGHCILETRNGNIILMRADEGDMNHSRLSAVPYETGSYDRPMDPR